MRSYNPKLASVMLSIFVSAIVLVANGCQTGGNEGDTCNPLVTQDECHSGLQCTQTTCTYAYCCPTSGSSANQNCNFGGCPSDDAGDDAASDDTDAATDDAADSASE